MKAVYSLILVMLVICLFSLTAWAEVGYTVKKGDTLGKIAQKFGVSVEELAKANNLNPDTILSIDQQLVIPYSNDKNESKTEIKPEKHTVIKGDCLDKIARIYNCTVDELLTLNDLKRDSTLKIGQAILLPTIKETKEEIPKDVTDDSKPRFKKEVSIEVQANQGKKPSRPFTAR
jgi:peptidoglycan endopeptidase LytE